MLREMLAARDVALPFFRNYLSDRFKPGRKVEARSLIASGFYERFQPDQRRRHSAKTLRGRLHEDTFVHSLPNAPALRGQEFHGLLGGVARCRSWIRAWWNTFSRCRPGDHRRRLEQAGDARALSGILPEKIRQRRWKVGFTTPEMAWLIARKDLVNDIFDSDSFNSRPYFDAAAVRDAFKRICAGGAEETLAIWRVLNLEIWLQVFFDKEKNITKSGSIGSNNGANPQ